MRLNLKSVEECVRPLGGRESYDREFIFDLMAAYGRSKGNITRLRHGSLNVADDPETEVAQKNVVYFKPTTGDLYATIDELRTSPTVVRFATRFVIVTDYVDLLAVDTKTNETLAIPIAEIDEHFTFFLPWAGMEKAQYVAEAHADVKAAERMAKLFDELLAINRDLNATETSRHALNVFFTRLLFCYFAEDTGVFKEGQFTSAVEAYTQLDGSDVDQFLNDLFLALDTEDKAQKPSYLANFDYVNGRLFAADQRHTVPKFNKKSRDALVELGKLRWEEINPDIFGSMFQAVVAPGQRSDLGQHYTSVPNILKTIDPLFMDELKEQFNKHFDSILKLKDLRRRISEIKIFDPACGSGNFLVIAYKELRKFEHAILERIGELSGQTQRELLGSWINIENFYGIEIDPFAAEVVILSMWIAKHQMNVEFREKFGIDLPLIPLKEAGQVHQGNATRVDWNSVCANNGTDEIYLISNPPYKGAGRQTADMKADFPYVFGNRDYSKNLDYIALWFTKGAEFIVGTKAELAFVTTNSVAQGQHVELMFPRIFQMGLEIGYAYTSFKWENNAKGRAGVTVAVISLRNPRSGPKYLYTDDVRIEAKNINGYLADGDMVFVSARRRPLTPFLPPMTYGSKPTDGGHLTMDASERDELVAATPEASIYVKRFFGADEFIDGKDRFCLWFEQEDLAVASAIPELRARFEGAADMRRGSKKAATRKLASSPHRFAEARYQPTNSVIFPSTSSERREYIPIGYLGPDAVISNKGFAVYDAEPWVFAVLTSRMHMSWTHVVAGRSPETRINYSNTIVYNNFPVPPLSDQAKERLTEAALRVLDVREYHSEKTLAELYDPEKMPGDLRGAHRELDDLVDRIYKKSGFELDEDRLSYLFRLYGEMAAKEGAK